MKRIVITETELLEGPKYSKGLAMFVRQLAEERGLLFNNEGKPMAPFRYWRDQDNSLIIEQHC